MNDNNINTSTENPVENDPFPNLDFSDFLVLEAISNAVRSNQGSTHYDGTGIFIRAVCEEYEVVPPFDVVTDDGNKRNVSLSPHDAGDNQDLIESAKRLLSLELIKVKEGPSLVNGPQYEVTENAAAGLNAIEEDKSTLGQYIRYKAAQ